MDYDTKDWLLEHLAENKREAARLRKNPSPQREKYLRSLQRSKPWPRVAGVKTASGRPALFRI
jgi:hypothetical protein